MTSDVSDFLKGHGLDKYSKIVYNELGDTMEDLKELNEKDIDAFKEAGMPKGPFRRLLRAVSEEGAAKQGAAPAAGGAASAAKHAGEGAAPPILVKDQQIIGGRFKVILNEGPARVSSGNSAVYVASDLERGSKKAALKMIRASSGEYCKERAFYQYCIAQEDSAKYVAGLLAAIDEFEDENANQLSILALEYGASNMADLCNDPTLGSHDRQKWAFAAVNCAAFLARCGVVWGDLKPANFIIVVSGVRQQLKMIDFTDAAVVPGTLDGSGRLVNKASGRVYAEAGVIKETFGPDDKMTAAFMPPERLYHCVLMGQTIPASPKMDVWCLAVLACNMFSGSSLGDEPLFSNADGDERRNALLKDLGNLDDTMACQAAEAKLRDMVSVRLAKADSAWRHAVMDRLLKADPECRESASQLAAHQSIQGGDSTVAPSKIIKGINMVAAKVGEAGEKVDEAIEAVYEVGEEINDEMQRRISSGGGGGGGGGGGSGGGVLGAAAAEVAEGEGKQGGGGDGDNVNNDRDALLTFFEAMGGEEGYLGGKWDLSQPVDKWEGVTVNGEGRVTELSITETDELKGDISEVQWPAALQELNLACCEEVRAVKWPEGLQELMLYETNVSGDLSKVQWPAALKELNLTDCEQITGSGLPHSSEHHHCSNAVPGASFIQLLEEMCLSHPHQPNPDGQGV
eukprot:g478.t1